MIRLTLAWMVVASLSMPVSAADYRSARIGTHETSLSKLIQFPESSDDVRLFVRCEARVGPSGAIVETGCYSDPKVDEGYYRAVSQAAQGATMEPALVDGQAVTANVLYAVLFRSQDGQRTVAVVPNHGTNAKEFGFNYIAPQRYGANRHSPRSEVGLLWIDAQMDAQGKARDINLIKTKWSTREASRYAKMYLRDNRFIPGSVQGEPRSMRFVRPVFGYRNGFMWQPDSSRCLDSSVQCDEVSRSGGSRFVFDD